MANNCSVAFLVSKQYLETDLAPPGHINAMGTPHFQISGDGSQEYHDEYGFDYQSNEK